MKALVTGAAGFIGSHVASYLVDAGHEVLGVDDFSGGFQENCLDFECAKADCRSSDLMKKAFTYFEPNVVYHLAAYAAEGLSHNIRTFNYQTNLIATSNLINHSVNFGVDHFVFTSSVAAYGHPHSDDRLSEETPLRPIDPYGIAKMACEFDIIAANSQFGLPFTIFRPHNVFGPRQNLQDLYRNVIGIFLRQAITKQPFTVFGDGLQQREFTYIDEIVPQIAMAPDFSLAQNEIFNIGSDASYTILDLIDAISVCFGEKFEVKHSEPRNEVKAVRLDHSKAKAVFSEIAETFSLQHGIQQMIEWAKNQDFSPLQKFQNIEIAENLPSFWR